MIIVILITTMIIISTDRWQRHVEELLPEKTVPLLLPLHHDQHDHREHVEQHQEAWQ